MITVIQGAKGFNKAKNYALETIVAQIRSCSLQDKVNAIRNEKDKKKKRTMKELLPSIMFSGQFKARGDTNCTIHSGLCCLDYDNVKNLQEQKDEIIKNSFVVAVFVSPSGNGLKVVCRIPATVKTHTGHYLALLKHFNQPELDTTSKNVERLCFASADADIYFNPLADTFTQYLEEEKPKIVSPQKSNGWTDYSKMQNAVKMIRDAEDGKKHKILLKAAKLAGGYIAGGIVVEDEAIRILESSIQGKGIDSFQAAQKTIRDGIEHGKMLPIIELEKDIFKKQIPTRINLYDDDYNFIETEDCINTYLESLRDGTFQMGLSTGIPSFDIYFRFKKGDLVIVNGADNTGKSTVIWYLMLLASINHNWKWILLSNENSCSYVKRKLIEFYCCKEITKIDNEEYEKTRDWITDKFTLIKSEELYNYKDIMNMSLKLMRRKQYNGILIDPYNALKIELTDSSKLSTHEYHYETASELRYFGKKHDLLTFLNCHVITNALRQRDKDGYQLAPHKADTEGGGKFANKADEFLTIHRQTQHETDWMFTQIHVRKVKEYESGGKLTPQDEPYLLKMLPRAVGFEDINGYNPITKIHNSTEQINFYEKEKAVDYSNPIKDLF